MVNEDINEDYGERERNNSCMPWAIKKNKNKKCTLHEMFLTFKQSIGVMGENITMHEKDLQSLHYIQKFLV